MTQQTVFNVQSFVRVKGKLRQGRSRQFDTMCAAMRTADILSGSGQVAGLLVFSVEGDAEFDDWSEPRLLARRDDVPEIEGLTC